MNDVLHLAGCSYGWLHQAPLEIALESLAAHGFRSLEVEFGTVAESLKRIGYRGASIYELIDMEPPGPRPTADIGTFEAAGWAPHGTWE